MTNTNLNPVVLIHGITGSRLITKSRSDSQVILWVNLHMMKQGSESDSGEEAASAIQSAPEVVGDIPEWKLDRSTAKEPDPWWKDNMKLSDDGVTPQVEKDSGSDTVFNRNVKGLKGLEKVFSDLMPDLPKDPETGEIIADLRYFKPLIEALKDKGYSEKEADGTTGNLLGAPYDWRTSPKGLMTERNDYYFAWLKGQIEQLYTINGENPAVIVAHSMGNRVTQYFLQWVKNSHSGQEGWGQAWIDKYIERYIAVAPPFLGGPMAIRLATSNDPVILAAIRLSGLKPVLQSFSSIPWILPVEELEEARYFNTSHFAFVKTGDDNYEPKDTIQLFTEAGGRDTILRFRQEYLDDPNFSDGKFGSKAIECPPVGKLDVMYAPGTETEIGAYYTESNGEFYRDTSKDEEQGSFVVKQGLRLETSETLQTIDGTRNAGDGVVPYASLVYFKKWREDPSVTTEIGDYPIPFDDADTVVGHERVIKDRRGIETILSLLGF